MSILESRLVVVVYLEKEIIVIDHWRTNLRLCDSGFGNKRVMILLLYTESQVSCVVKCEEGGLRAMNQVTICLALRC